MSHKQQSIGHGTNCGWWGFNLARLVVVSGLDHSIVHRDILMDNDRSHGWTSPNYFPSRMSLSYKDTPVDRIDGSYAIL